jgi:hypothetical protein
MIACPSCAKKIAENSSFCPECGSAVKPVELLCLECGTRNVGGDRFCLACGSELAKALPALPLAPQAEEAIAPVVSDDEEERKLRRQKAKELAQSMRIKAPLEVAPPPPSKPAENDHLANIKLGADPELIDESLKQLSEMCLVIVKNNLKLIKNKKQDGRYLQFLLDRLTVRTLLSDSPFQMPERKYE